MESITGGRPVGIEEFEPEEGDNNVGDDEPVSEVEAEKVSGMRHNDCVSHGGYRILTSPSPVLIYLC